MVPEEPDGQRTDKSLWTRQLSSVSPPSNFDQGVHTRLLLQQLPTPPVPPHFEQQVFKKIQAGAQSWYRGTKGLWSAGIAVCLGAAALSWYFFGSNSSTKQQQRTNQQIQSVIQNGGNSQDQSSSSTMPTTTGPKQDAAQHQLQSGTQAPDARLLKSRDSSHAKDDVVRGVPIPKSMRDEE